MNNKRKLVVTLIVLLAITVVYVFAFAPLRKSNSELDLSVVSLKAEIAKRQEQTNPEQATGEVGEIDQRILEISIPNKFDQDALIEQLADMASTNNMKLENISFGQNTTGSQFIDSVQIALNVTGGFYDFLEFLYDLEAQERFYNLHNFTLTIGDELPVQVNFSVSMEVYHS